MGHPQRGPSYFRFIGYTRVVLPYLGCSITVGAGEFVPQIEYEIASELSEKLNLYSSLTRVPIHLCIDEAVRNWLDTVAVVRLALIYEEVEGRGVHARLSASEKKLVAIVEDENDEQGRSINRNLGLNESARKARPKLR